MFLPAGSPTNWNLEQPTEFEIRQKNTQFAAAARAGKKPVNPSRQERLSKRSPINVWALGIVLFVVVGGGKPFLILILISDVAKYWLLMSVLFEIARLLFL
jgi:hypothetical protein